MCPGGSGAHAGDMILHHDTARALIRTHQRELEREAATRRLARIVRRRQRAD